MTETTLHFPKLSRFDRVREPVTFSVPCAQGVLMDVRHLCLYDGPAQLPVQSRALGHWPDGSIRWALVHFQPDLPGNAAKDFALSIDPRASQPEPEQAVRVQEDARGAWEIDTGTALLRIGAEGLDSLQRKGCAAYSGFVRGMQLEWQTDPMAYGPQIEKRETVEAGPLRVVIALRGAHAGGPNGADLAYAGLITAYAGKPYVEVEHQFAYQGDEPDIHLTRLRASLRPSGLPEKRQVTLGEGFYATRMQTADDQVAMVIDAETLLYQANEHFTESFYGDFWADHRTAAGGLAVSVYQAHQHYPKGLKADRQGIEVELYPQGQEPARILQGMGKTHRLLLHAHDGHLDLEAVSARSLQFQLPDVPTLPRSWYRDHNPWGLDFFPDRVPGRLLSRCNDLHAARPQALGMMHFGDAPDAGYTDQGRGGGETVWVNNEYDRPHMSLLFYGLTGQRRMLDSALVCARHWLDVDFCRHHPDPLIRGGLKIHTAYHGTGAVVPSHEWTEGLLDYYCLTGRREGLEAAEAIGRNVMRHMQQPRMRTPGAAAVREGGWALRAMLGLFQGTGDAVWKQEATRLATMFADWHAAYGALLAPYTSHTLPRVPFMISITVNSLARYLLVDEDARVKRLIADVVDDLLEHTLGPDGITYYKELPSLQHTAPTPHFLEALTHAFHVTGNEKYLQIGARQFAALMAQDLERRPSAKFVDAGGAVIAGRGGGRQFADRYSSLLLFAAAATPRGFLDWYEYPYPDVTI